MRPIDGADVLAYLIPTGGWTIKGDDFGSITYDKGVTPITKKQFEDGFSLAKTAKENEEKAKEIKRNAILARLGITEEEAIILLA